MRGIIIRFVLRVCVFCSVLLSVDAEAQSIRFPWSGYGHDAQHTVVSADNATQTIKASDTGNPFATAVKRFMHLRITRIP